MLYLLLACSLPESEYEAEVAEYEITCTEVACPNADEFHYNLEYGELRCDWYCVYLNEDSTNRVYLSMEFTKRDCWELDYVSASEDWCPNYW
jgi:hypothetical protein